MATGTFGALGSRVWPAWMSLPTASTRTFCRMVEVMASAIVPGRVKRTSTCAPGWMRPATPLTSVIVTATARIPGSMVAGMPSAPVRDESASGNQRRIGGHGEQHHLADCFFLGEDRAFREIAREHLDLLQVGLFDGGAREEVARDRVNGGTLFLLRRDGLRVEEPCEERGRDPGAGEQKEDALPIQIMGGT